MPSLVSATEFRFVYTYKSDKLQYKTNAATWEEALKNGAHFCFNFLTKREVKMTDEIGLDIIDTCANPRDSK